MKETTFYPTEEQVKRLAITYRFDWEKKTLIVSQSPFINGPVTSKRRTIMPAGGLYSIATDMARFHQMLLAGGEIDGHRYLRAETVKEMLRTQTGDLETGFSPGMSFGLGPGVVKTPQGVTAMLSPGTWGHGGAYGTQAWTDPVRKITFILMLQRSNIRPSPDGSDIRSVFQDAVVKALYPKQSISSVN
jgi:CubicO group peptidase (beta-lactamase class C family)